MVGASGEADRRLLSLWLKWKGEVPPGSSSCGPGFQKARPSACKAKPCVDPQVAAVPHDTQATWQTCSPWAPGDGSRLWLGSSQEGSRCFREHPAPSQPAWLCLESHFVHTMAHGHLPPRKA